MRRLLIVDGSEEFVREVRKALQNSYEICDCDNGGSAYNCALLFQPDVIVFDLLLSYVDGLSIVQDAVKLPGNPILLATTPFVSEYILSKLEKYRVAYVMRKPISMKSLTTRLDDLFEFYRHVETHGRNVTNGLETTLIQLGFQMGREDFRAICIAAQFLREESGMSVTKALYPAVASACDMTATQVEHAIRSAVKRAWETGDMDFWNCTVNRYCRQKSGCPTNSAFLEALASYVYINF